jgi:hypothetical protein
MMNQDFRAPQGCVRGTAGAGREAPAEGEGAGRDARYGIPGAACPSTCLSCLGVSSIGEGPRREPSRCERSGGDE